MILPARSRRQRADGTFDREGRGVSESQDTDTLRASMSTIMRVERFGRVPAVATRREVAAARGGCALVRVTHASVGATDLSAVRGQYLLQPVTGFVPGYDFVGTIELLGSRSRPDLAIGQRVAGVLPRMGAHATKISVAASLLVPVPEGLDPVIAATIPIDALTARFALDTLTSEGGSLLVQGASGAVGTWAVQMAVARGHTVFGTASPRSQSWAEALGAIVVDYRNATWIDELIDASDGGVVGAIDHTGSRDVCRAVAPDGRVVRIAFDGKDGPQRLATAAGFAAAISRRYARPNERVCSTPMLVATRRASYRRALTQLFADLTAEALTPPQPIVFGFDDYPRALAHMERLSPGEKVVLVMP